jgi:dolichol kinase
VLPRLRLSETNLKIVAWGLIVTAWGNILASIIGPLFGGRGLEFGGSVSNSLMYLLFVLAVVTVMVAIWLVYWGARSKEGAP